MKKLPIAPKYPNAIPQALTIQSHSACNFRCKFCAYHPTRAMASQYPMEMDLFKKIVDEFHRLDALKAICLSLQCEALLDHTLEEKIKYIKQVNPQANVSITSNGILMTPERFDSLMQTGLDTLTLSLDALSEESFKEVCSTDFEFSQLIEHIDYVLDHKPANLSMMITSMMIKETMSEFLITSHPIISKAKELGIPCHVSPISNHTGALPNYQQLLVMPELQSSKNKLYCGDIFESVYILANGDVIGCCSDWHRKHILGNMNRQSFQDIWESKRCGIRRQQMIDGNYDKLDPCRSCSQAWNIMENRKKWLKPKETSS